jgi:hypothetical protein
MYSVAKYMKACVVAVALLMSAVIPARAQNPFEDAIKQLNSDVVKGYLQPAINGFGANLNSGLYHSADISDGFHLELTIVGMGTMIGDAEKTYTAIAPQPFNQTPVQTATLFGGMGASVNDASNTIQYHFQNGQVKTSFIPFAAPQLTIGNIYGTQAIIRYVPIPEIDKFPKVTLFGIGLRHSVSQYLTEFPVDISGGFFYQTFKVGDLIDAKAFNIGVQASKSFSILTLYGGLQTESSSMKVSYTYTGPVPPGSPANPTVNLDFDGENKFRFLAGVGLDLLILHFNADINLGKVTVVSGGVGFGF